MKRSGFCARVFALLLAVVFLVGCEDFMQSEGDLNRQTVSDTDSASSVTESVSSQPTNSDNQILEFPDEPENTAPAYVEWMLEEKVHEIRIEISASDWSKICGNPYSSDYYQANVTIDGELVENVGLRTRGHGTLYTAAELYPNSHKYPLKIKFDKFEKDQTFMGLDELALNNGGDDYSFMRDYMGYGAFRLLGYDVSCVTFFNVYINDELRGFYVGVEAIDTSYLERIFCSHKKNLYEGENGANLSKYMPMSYLTQKKGKDESMDDVKQLISVLDAMPLGEKGEIENVLDVESVLRVLAVNAVLDNRDGYGGIFAHNYYLYNADGRFVMLPWDMNAPFMYYGTDIESPTMGVGGYSQMNSRPLAKKLMAVDEYYEKYLMYCRQLTEKLPQLKEDVIRIYSMIRESVENDPNKFCSSYYFNSYYNENSTYGTIYFLTKRYEYLMKRLEQLEGKPISAEALDPPPPPVETVESSSGEESQTEPIEKEEHSDENSSEGDYGQSNPVSSGESANLGELENSEASYDSSQSDSVVISE